MRFLFEEGEEVKEQYKTAISDARWIAYDIPGNVGWIAYLVCVFAGLLFAGLLLAGYRKQ